MVPSTVKGSKLRFASPFHYDMMKDKANTQALRGSGPYGARADTLCAEAGCAGSSGQNKTEIDQDDLVQCVESSR